MSFFLIRSSKRQGRTRVFRHGIERSMMMICLLIVGGSIMSSRKVLVVAVDQDSRHAEETTTTKQKKKESYGTPKNPSSVHHHSRRTKEHKGNKNAMIGEGIEVGTLQQSPGTPSGTHHRPQSTTDAGGSDRSSSNRKSAGGPYVIGRKGDQDKGGSTNATVTSIVASFPTPTTTMDRCEWLWEEFETVTAWMDPPLRAQRYHHQMTDSSTYFRATAHVFWKDFVQGHWTSSLLPTSPTTSMAADNEYRTHTWVLGDLHLLNFGSWKNSQGKLVYGMNDYDEGTIHDFQVDVMRLVISIYDHASSCSSSTNEKEQGVAVTTACRRLLEGFLEAYVETVQGYVGNEHALTADLTLDTVTNAGPLRQFLQTLDHDEDEEYSRQSQIEKYATFKGGRWKLDAGTIKKPKHKMAEVDLNTKRKIQAAFSGTHYGATMNRFVGFSRWKDESFQVLDVAARLNTGVGSFGVDRFFVLVSCGSCNEMGMVILDVKYQPPGSFRDVLSEPDRVWFDQYFSHAGSRVTEAHRKLTAFTDPWTGWILLDGDRPFTVRERSPWKEDLDLDGFEDDENSLQVFVKQLATSVATSHVRGNVGDAPYDFKNTIAELLGDALRLQTWQDAVIDAAATYHAQVQVDFDCFRSRVELHYP